MKWRIILIVLIIITDTQLFSCNAQVTSWNGPEGFASNSYYTVKVNGSAIPVYDTPIASWAAFNCTGEVEIEVNTKFDVRWVQVRPLRLGIKPEYTGDHSFKFKLRNPTYVSLELNGRIRQQPLFLFSGKPEQDIPGTKDSNVIWFKAGHLYQNTRLELKDNQTVYIEGGAVVQGYIYAKGKKNIRICGRGIMDGSFNKNMEGCDNRFISFTDCENVRIEDIVLHNGTTWQISLFHCNEVVVRGVKIVSESASDDGIDICRCRNVLVEDLFAHTKDDCIAIKSQGDYAPEEPTDQIEVKHCVLWNSIWGNALEIGFELYSNEVKNILFKDIDIIHVEDGATISIHNAGPARVHDVVFDDIRVEDSRQKLIDLAIFFSRWGPDGIQDTAFINKNYLHGAWDGVQTVPEGTEAYHRQFRGTIDHIIFKNIQVVDGILPFSVLQGYDQEKSVRDIMIENLSWQGRKILELDDAKIRIQNAFQITIK